MIRIATVPHRHDARPQSLGWATWLCLVRRSTLLVGALLAVWLAAACAAADGDAVVVESTANSESGVDLCQPAVVGADAGTTVVIYLVADGQLGDACFGSPLAVVEESWLVLTDIAPPEQLDAVTVFAGFEANASDDTVAFAAPVPADPNGDDGEAIPDAFVIAVEVAAADSSDDELLVTMAHEISHVFTQMSDQLDRSVDPEDCNTFYNGAGCFAEDALVVAWIDQFWTEDDLASLPEDGSADVDGGTRRCSLDPAFIGSYGASHPEEDFAESFAAYVFTVAVEPEAEQRVAFFDDYPELVAFRDRAAAADLDQLSYTFDTCG